jgi:hypothetical protein
MAHRGDLGVVLSFERLCQSVFCNDCCGMSYGLLVKSTFESCDACLVTIEISLPRVARDDLPRTPLADHDRNKGDCREDDA